MLWLIAHCFDSQTGYYKKKLACFHRQHSPLETCLLMAFAFASLLHNSELALLLTTDFLGQRTVRVKALQIARRTVSAALIAPAHKFDGVLGLSDRTASQVELSSHTDRSAKQGPVLDTTVQWHHVTFYKKLGFALSNTNENSPFDG